MLLRDKKFLWKMFDSPLRMSNAQYAETHKPQTRAALPIYQSATGGFGSIFGVNNTRVDVQHNIGLNTGFVYKCVELRANSQATAMLDKQKLYWYNDDEKEEIDDHPYWDLMRYVNDQHTPYDLWKFTASSFDFIGYCPWWVETENRFGSNIPVRINPIFPDMGSFIIQKDKFGRITGYELNAGIKPISFKPEEIFFHTDVNVNSSTYGLGLVNSMIREANIDQLQKQKVMKLLVNGGLQKAAVTFMGNPQGDEFKKAKEAFETANNGMGSEGRFLYKTDSTTVDSLVDPKSLESAVGILGLTRDQIINLSGCKRVSFESTNKADALMQEITYTKDVITPLINNLTSRLSQDFVQRYYPQEVGWLCVECDSIIPNDEIEIQTLRRMKLGTGQRRPVDFMIEDGIDPPDESENPAIYKYYLDGGLSPIDDTSLDFSDLMDKPKEQNNKPNGDNPEE